MKRNSIATSSLVVLSLLLTAAGAHAQSAVQAKVPFAFKVGTVQVPAGTYSIKEETATNIIVIHNVNTDQIVLAMGTRQSPSTQTGKLIFHHLGSQYILTEIWGPAGQGMAFPELRRDPELRVASATSHAGNTVEIGLW